jgi:hypothetical protein
VDDRPHKNTKASENARGSRATSIAKVTKSTKETRCRETAIGSRHFWQRHRGEAHAPASPNPNAETITVDLAAR